MCSMERQSFWKRAIRGGTLLVFHGEAVLLEKGCSGGTLLVFHGEAVFLEKGCSGGGATCVPWRGGLFGKGLFGGGGTLLVFLLEKGCSGGTLHVFLASFPVSLVESLAPADRGHAHFTTWL